MTKRRVLGTMLVLGFEFGAGACGGRTAGNAGSRYDVGGALGTGGASANGGSSPNSVGDSNTGGVMTTEGGSIVSGGQTSTGGSTAFPGCDAALPDSGGPGEAQSDASVAVAWVFQSASTNAAGMEVDLYCDGSAVWTITPTNMGKTTGLYGNSLGTSPWYFPAGTPEILQCLADIEQVGDLSSVVADGFCSKSVSFGTRTQISGFGHITADLQCKLMPLTDAQSQMISDCERLL
jgi:hypothetical protein